MCPADSSGAGPAGQNFRALSAPGDMSPRFTQQLCARSRVSKKHVLSVWNRARVQGRFGQYSTSGQDGRGAARPTLPGLCPPPRARVPCAPAEEAGHELDLTREGARSGEGRQLPAAAVRPRTAETSVSRAGGFEAVAAALGLTLGIRFWGGRRHGRTRAPLSCVSQSRASIFVHLDVCLFFCREFSVY